MITTRELLDHYKKKKLIAAALGISPAAVTNWPMDGPIPPAQELKIRLELLPGKLWLSDREEK